MRVSGNEPPSGILREIKYVQKLESDVPKVSQESETKNHNITISIIFITVNFEIKIQYFCS